MNKKSGWVTLERGLVIVHIPLSADALLHTANAMARNVDSILSRCEYEAFHLARQRLSNKEIAVRLNVSERAVKARMRSVFGKLSVSSRAELWFRFGMEQESGNA